MPHKASVTLVVACIMELAVYMPFVNTIIDVTFNAIVYLTETIMRIKIITSFTTNLAL